MWILCSVIRLAPHQRTVIWKLLAIAVLSVTWPAMPALAFTFAEGYSSSTPGEPALLYYRAFTLDEGREACEALARPTALRIRLPSTTLKVGERIHRMNGNPATRMDLVIEARDSNGALVPGIPIVVDVVAQKAAGASVEPVTSQPDRDYLEAVAPGTVTLIATTYCDYGPVRSQVALTIEE
jgi:hypothetical protein